MLFAIIVVLIFAEIISWRMMYEDDFPTATTKLRYTLTGPFLWPFYFVLLLDISAYKKEILGLWLGAVYILGWYFSPTDDWISRYLSAPIILFFISGLITFFWLILAVMLNAALYNLSPRLFPSQK